MDPRRFVAGLLTAVGLCSCGAAVDRPATAASVQPAGWEAGVCGAYTCDRPGARLGVAYSYRLGTHCGVLSTRFDGREFYVEAVDPSTVTSGLHNPDELGTMTLVSAQAAVFRSSTGSLIRFVDALPGVIGLPYPSRLYALSGTRQLVDRGFAGRTWRAQGSLPAAVGPPSTNGQDSLIPVDGIMTLTGLNTAVFHDLSGAEVPLADAGFIGCD